MKTSHLTRVALMLTLLIISAQFSIPIGPVAISLQSLVVLIIGLTLPKKQAVLTTLLYLFAGFIGLPIFSQAMGGPHSIFLPSFGFILSFIPAVWLMTKIRKRNSEKGAENYFQTVFVGNVIIYLIGLSYMTIILMINSDVEITIFKVLSVGFLPFIPADILKSLIAIKISMQLKKYLND